MNEIKCPHCGEAFTIDQAGYADILSQVKNKERTRSKRYIPERGAERGAGFSGYVFNRALFSTRMPATVTKNRCPSSRLTS